MERRWYMFDVEAFSSIDWSKTLITSEEAYWNIDNTQFIFPMDRNEEYLIDVCCNYDDAYISGILRDPYWKEVIL
jgi:hypothetical protein